MSFYDEMRDYVLHHGAINNPYLDRFKSGSLTDAEFKSFAVEFYNFARFFPKILVSQLVNTEDEAVAAREPGGVAARPLHQVVGPRDHGQLLGRHRSPGNEEGPAGRSGRRNLSTS